MTTLALSYDDLAERLGISTASARRLVQRRKWRKGKGNDGRAVVQVPEDFLAGRDSHKGRRKDSPTDSHDDDRGDDVTTAAPAALTTAAMADLVSRLATLQAEMAGLAQRLAAAEGRAGEAEGELRAVKDERDRLLGDLRMVHERMAKAEYDRARAVDALAAHMALPWWRRLFA